MLTTPAPAGRRGPSAGSIFVVEDDPDAERTIRKGLELSGYVVISAASGAEAHLSLREAQPDLIIMDLMLPDTDGLLLTTTVRQLTDAPIVICSGRQRQVDRVLSLKLGAAAFVSKPVDLDELEARIQAILRRTARPPAEAVTGDLRVGDLAIAERRARVTIADRPVRLTPTEYRLLVALARAPDTTFSREALLQQIWGYADGCDGAHLVDVHMGRLRSKLRAACPEQSYLLTVRGRGFCLTSTPTDTEGQ